MADDKLRATPAARKLADDLGINLYDVSGSGANGRVHKEDVETYKDTNVVRISPLAKRIALEHNIAWQEIQGTGHRGKIMKKDVLAFLPENIENDTIKSPAQIEKVEEDKNLIRITVTLENAKTHFSPLTVSRIVKCRNMEAQNINVTKI